MNRLTYNQQSQRTDLMNLTALEVVESQHYIGSVQSF